jgi:hypothetical protein
MFAKSSRRARRRLARLSAVRPACPRAVPAQGDVNRILNSTMRDVRDKRLKVDVLGDAVERAAQGELLA